MKRILKLSSIFILAALQVICVRAQDPPSNDSCGGAFSIGINDADRATTIGTIADGTIPACGDATQSDNGVWYTVQGDGSFLEASTCSGRTNFDTQITVFRGSCGSLVCVDGNDDDCGDRSTVIWESILGSTYFIYVSGSGDGVVGNFELSLDSLSPSNDLCSDATSLTIGRAVDQSTVFATLDSGVGSCGDSGSGSIGVWYTVEGEGRRFTASTCDSDTDFDTQISIFRGNCNSLTCVAGDDDTCGARSEVTWFALDGVTYHIYVHGFLGDVGNLQLLVDYFGPANDFCDDAIRIDVDDDSIDGTTLLATMDDVDECGDATDDGDSAPGVWYVVEGEGRTVRVSTCDSDTDYDTQISVFTNSCSDLECVDGNDDEGACSRGRSRVDFFAEDGEDYYILVHGVEMDTGDFNIVIETIGPPNDDCSDAVEIDIDDDALGFTTFALSDDDNDECGSASDDHDSGVWYYVRGNGRVLGARTCDSDTNFDTQVAVFRGDRCSRLQCVVGNNDACDDDKSAVVWESENAWYYILVYGNDNDRGRFRLEVEDLSPSNDNCNSRATLQVGSSRSGTTRYATSQTYPACGTASRTTNAPGVWHEVVGNGQYLRADTCDSSFDTQISVFTGSCNSLSCVDGNNDFCGTRSSVTWLSTSGTTYYILVYGNGAVSGDYEISIESLSPINNWCANAYEVTFLGTGVNNTNTTVVTAGTTTFATPNNGIPTCGTSSNAGIPGVWYSVQGSGRYIRVSTCHDTVNDNNVQVSVYSGTCGGDNLICVLGYDVLCGTHESVTFLSGLGTQYYIYVFGNGDFRLEIEDAGTASEVEELVAPPVEEEEVCQCPCGLTGSRVMISMLADGTERCVTPALSNTLVNQDRTATCVDYCVLPVLCSVDSEPQVAEASATTIEECACTCGENRTDVWVNVPTEAGNRCVSRDRANTLVNEFLASCVTTCNAPAAGAIVSPEDQCVCPCGENGAGALIQKIFGSAEETCVDTNEAYSLVVRFNIADYITDCGTDVTTAGTDTTTPALRGASVCKCTCDDDGENVYVRKYGENTFRCVSPRYANEMINSNEAECRQCNNN